MADKSVLAVFFELIVHVTIVLGNIHNNSTTIMPTTYCSCVVAVRLKYHITSKNLVQSKYCILSKNSSPKVTRQIRHLVAIRIGLSKIAKGDKYLDYPGETLERMVKLSSAIVIVK